MNITNTYKSLPKEFYSDIHSSYEYDPEIILQNDDVMDLLSIDEIDKNFLVGNKGGYAQAYAGHQFGHLTMLGDGRALVLGEVNGFDIQLKGSGPTPYSRGGDGRATLYSVLREYLISEALHSLGVPTTRSLAVIKTGLPVQREEMHQGALLVRVAKSHIRVGTFEYAASIQKVKELADYTIKRHYPDSIDYVDFYKKVVTRQAKLIAKWMAIGFVHGVMNTDNMLISGESIDYGPCAFMNEYSTETVFSSIDKGGRYKYGNQPYIGSWNLARFAETLLPLFSSESTKSLDLANEGLKLFQEKYEEEFLRLMYQKIGVKSEKLLDELLGLLETNHLDYTNTFISLSQNKDVAGLRNWQTEWRKLNPDFELMKSVSPIIIPRNNIVEETLREVCITGDLEMFNLLLKHLKNPYEDAPEEWRRPGKHITTYCGT